MDKESRHSSRDSDKEKEREDEGPVTPRARLLVEEQPTERVNRLDREWRIDRNMEYDKDACFGRFTGKRVQVAELQLVYDLKKERKEDPESIYRQLRSKF